MSDNELIIENSVLKKAGKACSGSVTVPSGVTQIENSAFANNPNITEVILPSTVRHIGEYAFYDCPALQSVYLPASVTTVYEKAFARCPALTIYCEAEPAEGWIEKTETQTYTTYSPEDDAFNFHRSSGSWDSHTETVTRRVSWNPDDRPIVKFAPKKG